MLNTTFKQPITNDNVYIFIRNYLLNGEFVWPNVKYIGKNVMLEYLKFCNVDLSYDFKVSENNINVMGTQWQM